ncbi:MAG: hypothetical protein ACYSUD_03920, partial [Planctomycetota bacterium]
MKAPAIICALAGIILVAARIAKTAPTSSYRVLVPNRYTTAETKVYGWDDIFGRPSFLSEDFLYPLLTASAESYRLDSPSATFTDHPGGTSVWNSQVSDDDGWDHIETSLIAVEHGAGSNAIAWEHIQDTEDANYLDLGVEIRVLGPLPALSAVFLAGIAAGFVGWLRWRT